MLFGQKCDTLLTKDGRQILGKIVGTRDGGLLYVKCGDGSERQYFLEKEKVQAIHYQPFGERQRIRSKAPSPTGLPAELSRPKTIVWAGVGVLNLVGISDDEKMRIRLGIEIGIKNTSFRAGLFFQPIALSKYGIVEKEGFNGEFAAVFKQFSYGRVSGHVSKAYWGLDVRGGGISYLYDNNFFSNATEKRTFRWVKVMPRVGYQWRLGPFALDFNLPLGVQKTVYSNPAYSQSWFDLTLNPSLCLGVRL